MSRIYVASSWRNRYQPEVVTALRNAGHEVYDFRHPFSGTQGFHWSEIDGGWQSWNATDYRNALLHPIADRGFEDDFAAMKWADTCVLVLPSGRSAHAEAGWMAGHGKIVHLVLLEEHTEPELMYRLFDDICLSVDELLAQCAADVITVP